jgi:hypothetical protein
VTHPCWPDGAKVELGHLFRKTFGSETPTIFTVAAISLAGELPLISGLGDDGQMEGSLRMDQIERVLPPRPVAGEIPEHLAAWLESTGLTADDVRNGPELYSSGGWMAELLAWAKALLVVDAEIVEDDEPRCDATHTNHAGHVWTCDQEAKHVGAGHHDPERGWW